MVHYVLRDICSLVKLSKYMCRNNTSVRKYVKILSMVQVL